MLARTRPLYLITVVDLQNAQRAKRLEFHKDSRRTLLSNTRQIPLKPAEANALGLYHGCCCTAASSALISTLKALIFFPAASSFAIL